MAGQKTYARQSHASSVNCPTRFKGLAAAARCFQCELRAALAGLHGKSSCVQSVLVEEHFEKHLPMACSARKTKPRTLWTHLVG
ncbi:hypothetical protein Y032_0212g2235 [Ancylostoma ceylanicum]|nr:hypothetical protein Y032_0212g2235 [Ancylostoma ceylanicum]